MNSPNQKRAPIRNTNTGERRVTGSRVGDAPISANPEVLDAMDPGVCISDRILRVVANAGGALFVKDSVAVKPHIS